MEKNKGIFKRMIKMIPNKSYFIIGIIFIVGLSLIQIFISFFLKNMTDAVIDNSMELFLSAFYFLLGLSLLEIIFTYIRTAVIGISSERTVKSLRNKLVNHLNELEIKTFTNKHTGDYVSRSTNDISKIKGYIENTFPNLLRVILTGILALIYLLILSWKLTIITLSIFPVLIIIVGVLSKPIGSFSKKLQEKLGVINSLVQDYIKGVEVSKSYTLEKVLNNSYQQEVDKSVYLGKKIAKRKACINSFSELFGIIPFFICFFIGGYYVIQDEMSVGGLLAFINLLNYLAHPIKQIPKLISQSKVELASAERVFEVLDEEVERKDGNIYSINVTETDNLIEFCNVNFSYSNRNQIINNLNIKIKKGEKVAIVGHSGSGKSTLISLLQGYYDTYDGEIKVAGKDIKKWNLKSLRDNMALVSQDTYLFPESVRENIKYGKGNEEVSFEKIISASRLANAHQFIEEYNGKYETQIGELGNKLSGGQKQRIAIARAILKNSDILLLDETTSSLDNESESFVQEALDHLMKDKTSVVIAHRLSTLKNVDKIFILDEGSIIAEGTHEQLLLNNKLYNELYTKQMNLDNENGKLVG